jgi:hypothetical protein
LGEGKLNILVIANITMAVLNVILSFIFGLVFNGLGIILGWVTFSIRFFIFNFAYSNK